MKKYEAWEMLNCGCWEQDAYSEPIEAESAEEALEVYLDSIEDNLRAVDALRVYDPVPGSATFEYETEEDCPETRLVIMMMEVEEEEE